jgi:hypothetical protein
VLAQSAASAAAGGHPLPLQRLVLENGYTLQDPDFCRDTLAPLFSSLPQLQHLHLYLWAGEEEADWRDDTGHKAAVAALAPLRHLTSLTSLHLHGPSDALPAAEADATGWNAEVLSCLPSSLAQLKWDDPHCLYTEELVCDRVTGLTELHLVTTAFGEAPLPEEAYSGLPRLRKLQLDGFDFEDAWLLEHKEVVQGLALHMGEEQVPGCLGQLVNLRTLDLRNWLEPAVVQAAVAAAPQVTQLHLALPHDRAPTAAAAAAAVPPDGRQAVRVWLAPVLELTGLRALTLEVPRTCTFLPLGLGGLSQLTRLHARFSPNTPGTICSWVAVVERLVNLQVLTVPAITVACCHQWLTGLTKLGVLELVECSLPALGGDWETNVSYDLEAAADHLQCLVSTAGAGMAAGSTAAEEPAAAAAAGSRQSSSRSQQLQLVCVDGKEYIGGTSDLCGPFYRHLWRRLAGDVALFSGSLGGFLQCGWQLWPQPTAARLQQLLGDMV